MDQQKQKQETPHIIGKGSYGCVYLPPLLCNKENKPKYGKSFLTKAQLDDVSERELAAVEAIRKIPDRRNYFIIPEKGTCHPNPKQIKLFSECDPIKDLKKDDIQLFHIEYGGKPIFSMSINIPKFNLKAFTLHMLEALVRLRSLRKVHADLHTGNIVLNELNYNPRIIDFGQTISMDEKDVEEIKKTFFIIAPEYPYHQIPPEYTFVSGANIYPEINPSKIRDYIFIIRNELFTKISTTLFYTPLKQKQHFAEFIESMNGNYGVVDSWHRYSDKYDIWSLGTDLVFIIDEFMKWKEFNVNPALLTIIRKMCCLDPRKRPTPEHAIYLINKLVH